MGTEDESRLNIQVGKKRDFETYSLNSDKGKRIWETSTPSIKTISRGVMGRVSYRIINIIYYPNRDNTQEGKNHPPRNILSQL